MAENEASARQKGLICRGMKKIDKCHRLHVSSLDGVEPRLLTG